MKLVAPSGSVYEGDIMPGAQSGKFKCEKNGNVYDGEFLGDKFHGFGKLFFASGSFYVGCWCNGYYKGLGEWNAREIDAVFRGEFDNDLPNGPAEIAQADNLTIRGLLINGKVQGHGVLVFPGNQVYSGELLKLKSHGFGEMQMKNGDQYLGEWSEGTQQGIGRLITTGGEVRDRVWAKGVESTTPCDFEDILARVQTGIVSCLMIIIY